MKVWAASAACGLSWLAGAHAGVVVMGSILHKPLAAPIFTAIVTHMMLAGLVVVLFKIRTR